MADKREILLDKTSKSAILINKDIADTKEIIKKDIKCLIRTNTDLLILQNQAIHINDEACEYKKNAEILKEEASCCNPKMRYVAVIIIVIGIFVGAYFIAAAIRCQSANVIC